jgi:hypothetical protein
MDLNHRARSYGPREIPGFSTLFFARGKWSENPRALFMALHSNSAFVSWRAANLTALTLQALLNPICTGSEEGGVHATGEI